MVLNKTFLIIPSLEEDPFGEFSKSILFTIFGIQADSTPKVEIPMVSAVAIEIAFAILFRFQIKRRGLRKWKYVVSSEKKEKTKRKKKKKKKSSSQTKVRFSFTILLDQIS